MLTRHLRGLLGGAVAAGLLVVVGLVWMEAGRQIESRYRWRRFQTL